MTAANPGGRFTLHTVHEVRGPWSLTTSKAFWEGFAPSALAAQHTTGEIRTVFLADDGWQRVEASVAQEGGSARIAVTGPGDLDTATAQVCRFLSLDIDAETWPEVGRRDPVIANAQKQLPGLRPCGFYSPYEAAAWSVLTQRISMRQAATMKAALVEHHGEDGAFPAPAVLRGLSLDLPGRKEEYLHAVAEAALAGQLNGAYLRSMSADDALRRVQEIKGLGPFAAELVVIRGANFPDVLPQNEKRLSAEITEQYGSARSTAEITGAWAPFRSWAGVHLRALREYRTHEIERGQRAR
jgi:DNA-3-methyladenine glycosylase II